MMKIRTVLIVIVFVLWSGSMVFAQGHMYATWDTLEIDTCASAWLIKNFVDTEAEFRFFPKGEIITEGIPFDTPDSDLRRTGNMSAFETILAKYKITDPALKEIGRIIHDIEINYWGKKETGEAVKLNQEIKGIIDSVADNPRRLEKSSIFFDALYKRIIPNSDNSG